MNLSEMTIEDVESLSAISSALAEAARAIARLDRAFEVRISMMPGREVKILSGIRMPMADDSGDPAPFVIEDAFEAFQPVLASGETGPVVAVASEMVGGPGGLQRHCHADGPPADGQREQAETCEVAPEAVTGAGESPAQISDAATAARPGDGAAGDGASVAGPAVAAAPDGLVMGPLTDAERAEIQRLDAEGLTRPEIAKLLRRKTQTVALFLHALANPPKGAAARPDQYKAAQPAPVAEQALVADPVGADAVAEAPVAVKAAPVGEIAEAGSGAAPNPAPVAGGADPLPQTALTSRQRDIWAALDRLRYKAPWTAKLDLALAEDLAKGFKLQEIATDLGIDYALCLARWDQLVLPLRDEKNRIVLEDRIDLLKVLRLRAGEGAAKAA